MDGLIVVDVQNDFCSGGALAVPDGDAVIEAVNRLAREASYVVATRDWHPPDHSSFAAEGGPWPVHCVRDTPGAQFHPGLDTSRISDVVNAGRTRDAEGYSGFEDTPLERLLREHDVDTVHVGGLALDYCVKATALDAKRAGFDVIVHRGATRPVEVAPGDGDRAVQELREAGVQVVD
jgi:nicotinamidase/pyrazinamidase